MADGRSTHQMVENLHARFSGLEVKLDQLHGDHRDLKDEVEELAADLTNVKSWADRHEEVAILKLEALWGGLSRVEAKVDQHAKGLNDDKKMLFTLVWATLLSALGGLLMMLARSAGVW